jgi:ferric-dicitrate binding protein FerR (iron transport regulator)
MSAPSTPAWFLAANRRRTGYSSMRISDAERSEAADLLSRHYGDGRLDEAEFNQRLDQAMRAKTYSDLSGLFDDLPRTEAEAAEAPRRTPARRHDRHGTGGLILLAALAVAAMITAGHVLAWFGGAWIWLLLLLGVLLFVVEGRRRRS